MVNLVTDLNKASSVNAFWPERLYAFQDMFLLTFAACFVVLTELRHQ